MSSQIVTWALVVIGWIIVDDRNNARESRKEAKYLIDGIKDNIEQVKDNAITYHTSKTPSPELSLKIKLKLKNIGERTSLLKSYGFQIDVKYIADMRKSITQKNFDTNEFHQLDHNNDIIFDIIECTDYLFNNLDHAFMNRYSKCLFEILIDASRRFFDAIKSKILFVRGLLYKGL